MIIKINDSLSKLSTLLVLLLVSCINTNNSPNNQTIHYFEVSGVSLHTQMPKDSVILLLGNPHDINSIMENGILKEEIQYVIPKSKDDKERIKKLNDSLKAGLLELDVYKTLLNSLISQLSLKLENGVLVGYSIN